MYIDAEVDEYATGPSSYSEGFSVSKVSNITPSTLI